MADEPNPIEQMILLSLVHLGESAYGVPIRSEIETRSGRAVSMAAVYGALERLESRGHVRSWYSEPVAERGGRSRKHFGITRAGARALREAREVMDRMWRGIEEHPDLEVS